MTSIQTTVSQTDFSGGSSRDVAPHLIDPNALFDAVNCFLAEDGSPIRRGGTSIKSNAPFGTTGLTFIWDGYLSAGQRTVFSNASDFGVLGSDDATPVNLGSDGLPYPRVAVALDDGYLIIGGGYIYAGSRKSASYTTGTISVTNGSATVVGSSTTWNTLTDAGMLLQIGDERVYAVKSIDSTTGLTLTDPYAGTTGSGKSYTLWPLYKMTNADPYPVIADDRVEHFAMVANRLVWGSGSTVAFSPLGADGTPQNHSQWNVFQDYHRLPDGVRITGLAAVGQVCLVFTTGGTYALSNLALDIVDVAGNPQHRIDLIAPDLILLPGAGIAGFGGSLIVPATDGIYLMDGISAPQKVSRPIDNLYTRYVRVGYRAGQGAIFKGHYLLPLVDSSGGVGTTFVCRIDRPIESRGTTTYPWVRFAGSGGELPALTVRTGTSFADPILLGAQKRTPSRVVDCSHFFTPDTEHREDADGTSHTMELITRDYETGNLTKNMVRSLRCRYELTGTSGVAPARWDEVDWDQFLWGGDESDYLDFAWGDGIANPSEIAPESAVWDQVNWDAFDWDSFTWTDQSAIFTPLSCVGPPDDGKNPVRCRVNKPRRYIRFRIRSQGRPSYCAVRSLELFIRPSEATRR